MATQELALKLQRRRRLELEAQAEAEAEAEAEAGLGGQQNGLDGGPCRLWALPARGPTRSRSWGALPTSRWEPPTPRSEPPTPRGEPPTSRREPPAFRWEPPASKGSLPAFRWEPPASKGSPPASRREPPASRREPPASKGSPPASRWEPPASRGGPPAKELTANADSELRAQLSRRQSIHEGKARPRPVKVFQPHTEFPEFSRRQIKDMESLFRRYDSGKDGYIDLMELKLMMEKLGAPQTHLGLKNMIKEVDEDLDSKLSFREFLLIFRKAAAGELEEDSGLMSLAKLSEINVAIEGVKGAKNFFEAKVQALALTSKFEAEIKAEQMARKQEEEERKHRRALFRERQAAFSQ